MFFYVLLIHLYLRFVDNDCASIKSAPAHRSPTAIASSYRARANTISSFKPLSKLNLLTHEQQSQTKMNLSQTSKARRSIEPMLSKPLTRKSMQLEQEIPKPTVRRNSFYISSSANSNISLLSKPSNIGLKFTGNGKYNTSKTNLMVDSDLSKRYESILLHF